ncbi:Flp pilus assembly complex ATPase component TadA [bacterium]|nr:Flp pilus assembly complex ATPase component TadA [bacterium]
MPENVYEKIKTIITPEAQNLFTAADIKSHIFVPINKQDDGKWLVACSDKTDIQEVSDFVRKKIDKSISVVKIDNASLTQLIDYFSTTKDKPNETDLYLKKSQHGAKTEKRKLGEILIDMNLISQKDLDAALLDSKVLRVPIGSYLVRKNLISIDDLKKVLQIQQGIAVVESSDLEIDEQVVSILPEDFIKQHKVIPLKSDGKTITVGVTDPSNKSILNEIVFISGLRPIVKLVTHLEFESFINKYFNESKKETQKILKELEADAEIQDDSDNYWNQVEAELGDITGSVVKFANKIITDAIDMNASDIHIEPTLNNHIVRYRIDGMLKKMFEIPQKVESQIITRFKVLARMNIAEHRRPQDGTFTMKYQDKAYDFRLNTLPVGLKEKMVIRILAPAITLGQGDFKLTLEGATNEDIKRIERAIAAPNGILLASGPTGSGKTTTLYSLIRTLNKEDVNITTIEDPIEIKLEGVNQSQINEKAGITFVSCLRAILRQDPDIILVGEIRDTDTLNTAISAALTGHFVLSTVHTNSAASTITRLIEMGAKDYLVSSTLVGVIAQRLVRKLCPHCKVPINPSYDDATKVIANSDEIDKFMQMTIYEAKGCGNCNYTGYTGRMGVYEILLVDREMKKLIAVGAHDIQIEEVAIAGGMRTLHQSCLNHIINGDTTISEFMRVLGPVYQ